MDVIKIRKKFNNRTTTFLKDLSIFLYIKVALSPSWGLRYKNVTFLTICCCKMSNEIENLNLIFKRERIFSCLTGGDSFLHSNCQ